MEKLDYKKRDKKLYQPKGTPVIVEVPEIIFIMVDGKGDPNTCEAYKEAIELLYGLSFGIKMSKMSGHLPNGYFEYVMPPLEGLWWLENEYFNGKTLVDKSKFCWTSMIRQPEFVTEEVFKQAKESLIKKKPNLDVSRARLEKYKEGLCVQIMHQGCYDSEPETIEKMQRYLEDTGYQEHSC